jgi:hypothetical protein
MHRPAGWGYSQFDDGKALTHQAALKSCFDCHQAFGSITWLALSAGRPDNAFVRKHIPAMEKMPYDALARAARRLKRKTPPEAL